MRKTLNNLLKQFSRQLLFCASHFFGYFHLRRHTVVPEKTPYIHAHSAKPILNQNNQTNLTRYVSFSRVPLLLYTVAYGNSIPEETNARFGRLWNFVSSRSPIITSSSFCRINLLSSTNLFRAKLRQVRQVRVFSRSVCSQGLRESGGCGRTGRVWACGFY